jgi:hypothetical protein
MDWTTVMLLEMLEDDDEEEDDDILIRALVGTIVGGVDERRAIRARLQNMNRAYFVRNDLLQNPRSATPWARLREHGNERAFIVTMGVDCETFDHILDSGFREIWDSRTIPRGDTNSQGVPRIHRRSLDADGALALVLHWISSTMPEISLQSIFALIPATVSRYIRFARKALLQVLRTSIMDAQITWPGSPEEFHYLAELIVARHPLLWGGFAFMDGMKLPTSVSSDPMWENATYNGWLHEHFTSNVLAQSAEGKCVLLLSTTIYS